MGPNNAQLNLLSYTEWSFDQGVHYLHFLLLTTGTTTNDVQHCAKCLLSQAGFTCKPCCVYSTSSYACPGSQRYNNTFYCNTQNTFYYAYIYKPIKQRPKTDIRVDHAMPRGRAAHAITVAALRSLVKTDSL